MAFLGSFMTYKPSQLSDLDFDLQRSLRVKWHGDVGLCMYELILVVNNNIWPYEADLWDIRQQNRDLDIDLSRSLKSNIIAPIHSPYMLSY